MEDLLYDDNLFDRIRRRTFKKQLDSHPVYDFWLRVIENHELLSKLYRPDRLLVDQCLLQVFYFAMQNGFFELVTRLWTNLSEGQKETIGFLCWKKICFSGEHRELTRFLCEQLCAINARGMVRLTWDTFYDKVYKSLDENLRRSDQQENLRKLETLLENWCGTLRAGMLSKENFRALTDTFVHSRIEPFILLLEHLESTQLNNAREFLDRIYDRKKTTECRDLRKMVINRQQTIG